MALSKADIKLIQKTMAETNNSYQDKLFKDVIKYILFIALGFVIGMAFGAL